MLNAENIQPKPVRWEIHLAIWLVYSLIWLFILNPAEQVDIHFINGQLIFTSFNALVCYANVFVLMPRYFNNRQYWLYLPFVLLLLAVGSVMLSYTMYAYLYFICDCGGEFFLDIGRSAGSTFGSNSSVMFVGMIVHLYRQRRALQSHQQELEKTQLKTELKYLKSQLNPHFLFNVLNSIYFLIKKDPDQAAEALAGFSDILRFQIYRTDEDRIPLGTEIENLEKYVKLAALRKSEKMKITLDMPQDIEEARISPLLLLPLVENAFKHSGNGEGFIRIKGELRENSFIFSVNNSFEKYLPLPEQVEEEGGIGLANIRRRLDLLYKGKYELMTEEGEKEFKVRLKLDLI